jgi:hypothetical protein
VATGAQVLRPRRRRPCRRRPASSGRGSGTPFRRSLAGPLLSCGVLRLQATAGILMLGRGQRPAFGGGAGGTKPGCRRSLLAARLASRTAGLSSRTARTH